MPIDFLNVPRPGPPREAREPSLPDLLWSGVRSLPGIQYTPGPATPKTDPRSRFTGGAPDSPPQLPRTTPIPVRRFGKFLPKRAGLPEPRSPNYTRL